MISEVQRVLVSVREMACANLFSSNCLPSAGTVALKVDNRTVMSANTKPQWCRHCDVVVLGNGVRKTLTDLPFNKQVCYFMQQAIFTADLQHTL